MFPYLIDERETKKSSRSDSPKRNSVEEKNGENYRYSNRAYSPRMESKGSNLSYSRPHYSTNGIVAPQSPIPSPPKSPTVKKVSRNNSKREYLRLQIWSSQKGKLIYVFLDKLHFLDTRD